MIMITLAKMLAITFLSITFTIWYLSDHPRPMSNADATFMLVSALTTLLVASLIWWIDDLREDKEQLELVRKFVRGFLDPQILQSPMDRELSRRATVIDRAVQRSILFQKSGMEALGMSDDGETEEQQAIRFQALQMRIESDVKIAKDSFWRLYDLAESCQAELYITVKTPRSYKSYLPSTPTERQR